MKLLSLALLVLSVWSLTFELNNIHNGYRNVYKGHPHVE